MEAGGHEAFLTYITTHRRLPFLKRNLTRAIPQLHSQAMGSALSMQHGDNSSIQELDSIDPAADDMEDRPAKRRKLGGSVIDRIPSRPKFPSSHMTRRAVSMSNLQGHKMSKAEPVPKTQIADLLFDPKIAHPESSVWIDVLQIIDNRSLNEQEKPVRTSVNIPIQCTIAIFTLVPSGTGTSKDKKRLIQTSQIGRIETVVDEAGQRFTRVRLPSPFMISVAQLSFNQRRNQSLKTRSRVGDQPTMVFGMAENYVMEIICEVIGSLTVASNWPPMDMTNKLAAELSSGSYIPEEIQLVAQESLLVNIDDPDLKPEITMNLGHLNEKVPFAFRVDTRWRSPIKLQVPKTIVPSPTSVIRDVDVELIYTFAERLPDGSTDERQQEVSRLGFLCALCQQKQASIDMLQYHLRTEHQNFQFECIPSKEVASIFYINFTELAVPSSLVRSGNEVSQVLQLGPPRTKFNLQKYLHGDEGWINSRRGPLDQSRMSAKRASSSVSSIPESSRSSPITSVDLEIEKLARAPLTVPRTKQRLFHTISKHILKPGDELSGSDEDVDQEWQIAKHRDIINDFEDVTDEEKDYIIRWDSFMLRRKITTNRAMPGSLIRFVSHNKAWFAERQSRVKEFGKHAATLILRESIDAECFKQCFTILRTGQEAVVDEGANSGESQGQVEEPERNTVEASSTPVRRGCMDCLCGNVVIPPGAVICRGAKCRHRYYHRQCLPVNLETKGWKCKNCLMKELPQGTSIPLSPQQIVTLPRPLPTPTSVSPQSVKSNSPAVPRRVPPTAARKSGSKSGPVPRFPAEKKVGLTQVFNNT